MEFIDIVLQLQLSNAENRRGRQTDRQTLRQTRRRTNTRFSERRTESIQISHAVTRHVALAISQLGADIARVWQARVMSARFPCSDCCVCRSRTRSRMTTLIGTSLLDACLSSGNSSLTNKRHCKPLQLYTLKTIVFYVIYLYVYLFV